jgi:hypothetical protein
MPNVDFQMFFQKAEFQGDSQSPMAPQANPNPIPPQAKAPSQKPPSEAEGFCAISPAMEELTPNAIQKLMVDRSPTTPQNRF